MQTEQIENDTSQRGLLFRVSHAIGSAAILTIACLLSYWVITTVLTHEYSVSREDDLLGGMWAVVATIFVYRTVLLRHLRSVKRPEVHIFPLTPAANISLSISGDLSGHLS